MNANELADALEAVGTTEVIMCDAATMLRQQQAEIDIAKEIYEKLTKENAYFMNKNEFLLSVIKDKDAEIAILRKAQEK